MPPNAATAARANQSEHEKKSKIMKTTEYEEKGEETRRNNETNNHKYSVK